MTFWIVASLLAAGVAAALALPLLFARRGSEAGDGRADLAIYRDQLAEIERDSAAGLLDAEAGRAARLEVQRRLIAAAETGDGSRAAGGRGRSVLLAAGLALAVPAAAVLGYLALGQPGTPDRPFAGRATERAVAASDPAQVRAMVESLRERLERDPSDLEGWLLLARSERVLGRLQASADAWARAAQLAQGDPDILSGYGEALVLAADGSVVPEARRALERAHAARPGEPRARFYLGLASAQAGDYVAALDWWARLEADSPADAPWLATLRAEMAKTAEAGGLDLEGFRRRAAASRGPAAPVPPPATSGPRGPTAADVAAAQAMSPEERMQMIRSMVATLAERLEKEPDDAEGWKRLARSYGVLKEPEKAREAYERAAALSPDDVELLLDYARHLFPPGTPPDAMPPAFEPTIRRVLALAPDNPEALFLVGLIEAEQGRPAAARALWGRLLGALPEGSPARGELERRLEALPR